MFKKSETIPQRKPLSLTGQQILDDIESIKHIDEQRGQLFHCLDETLHQDSRIPSAEQFLARNKELEDMRNDIKKQLDSIEKYSKIVYDAVDELKEKSKSAISR